MLCLPLNLGMLVFGCVCGGVLIYVVFIVCLGFFYHLLVNMECLVPLWTLRKQ